MYVGIIPCALHLLFTPVSAISAVILMLRTYAFSGRKKAVLAILSIAFFGLAGVIIWVTSQKLTCLFRRPRLSRRVPDAPIESQCRICSLFLVAAAVSPFRINRLWTKQLWPG